MNPLPWRWPPRAKAGAYALANLVLLYLCLAPAKALPPEQMSDKAEHAIAWGVLTGLGLLFWPGLRVRVAAYALALGALVEVLQATLPLGRDGDWRDWIADAIGVGLALAVGAALGALARRR